MQTIIFTKEQLADRIVGLGKEISAFYAGKPLTVVVVMNGAMLFAADLIRAIRHDDLFLDSMAVSSYQNDVSSGTLNFRSHLKLPVKGRHVLVVDDILDTGRTMARFLDYIKEQGAESARCCVLLSKKLGPGKPPRQIAADWFGFEMDDVYVIGYGLDSYEKYRELPDIRAILPDCEK